MSGYLKCKECGRLIIYMEDDGIMKTRNVVVGNVQSDIKGNTPQDGDVFRLTCRCGFEIIEATNDYLIGVE